MFDRGLKLLDRDIASREYDLSVDLNGRELGQGRPLEQAEGRLLDDLYIERILLLQLRDHGGDMISPFSLRIVEVEPYKHVQPPVRSFCIAIWGIVTSVKTPDTAV